MTEYPQMSDTTQKIQEHQRKPSRINVKNTTSRLTIFTLLKKNSEKDREVEKKTPPLQRNKELHPTSSQEAKK